MSALVALLTAAALVLHPMHHKPADAIATTAQIEAEINVVDPGRTIDWRLSITNGYQTGDVYGVALPWYGIVMLAGNGLPTAGDEYKGIIAHEWAHVLQYRWVGSNVENFYQLEKLTDTEQMADCISRIITGVDHFQDCYYVSRQSLAPRVLADVAAGRTYTPTPGHLPSPTGRR